MFQVAVPMAVLLVLVLCKKNSSDRRKNKPCIGYYGSIDAVVIWHV